MQTLAVRTIRIIAGETPLDLGWPKLWIRCFSAPGVTARGKTIVDRCMYGARYATEVFSCLRSLVRRQSFCSLEVIMVDQAMK